MGYGIAMMIGASSLVIPCKLVTVCNSIPSINILHLYSCVMQACFGLHGMVPLYAGIGTLHTCCHSLGSC